MDPRCKGMPLSSFILKPMQRVTRYPLIIKNVSSACVPVLAEGGCRHPEVAGGRGQGGDCLANVPGSHVLIGC